MTPIAYGELTDWGKGLVVGVGIGTLATLLAVFVATCLVLDSLSARWGVVTVERGRE